MSHPSIFDVRDGDRIRPAYEVPGTGLVVKVMTDDGYWTPPRVYDLSGRYQEKRTLALRYAFLSDKRNAATMHAIGSWLRGNA